MSTFKTRLVAVFTVLSCALLSQPGLAGWSLNSDNSSLYYVTSKAAAVSELNSFARLDGSIADDGSASVSIYLDSVETAIDIRNERMREIVFQVANYPLAMVALEADAAALTALTPGKTLQASHDATISLKGEEQAMAVEVLITGLENGGLLVSLARPLLVNAAVFGLADEVEQLREIAGLPSINNNVVVDFTLQFDPD